MKIFYKQTESMWEGEDGEKGKRGRKVRRKRRKRRKNGEKEKTNFRKGKGKEVKKEVKKELFCWSYCLHYPYCLITPFKKDKRRKVQLSTPRKLVKSETKIQEERK